MNDTGLYDGALATDTTSPSSHAAGQSGPTLQRAMRIVCSFPVALSALLVVLVVLTVRSRFNDPDMWWHLKTGEIIWNTHHIPTVDTFSYTVAGHAWILQEWLAQLTIYAAYHFGGYSGMMLWLCIFASALLIAGYLLCSVYSGNAKVAFLGALTIWLFSTVGLSIRPQLIGYLLLIGELLLLHLGQTRNRRWFYALPVLFCLWINAHSSFIFGLVVLGIVLFCCYFEFQVGLLISSRWTPQLRKALLLASVASIAALFVNPIGPKLIFYPTDVMLNQSLNLSAVSEWQPPQFSDGRSMLFLAVAGLVLLIPILRRIPIRLTELLFLVVGFGFAVRHERMLFVFGILVAPVLCRLLADAWETYEFSKDRILPNAVMVGLALAVALLALPSSTDLNHQIDSGNPVRALKFIRQSGLTGNMLNDYRSGGYLIWAAPEHKVFIDGRADVYDPTGVMEQFGKWAMLEDEPAKLLEKYHIEFAILGSASPVSHVLPLMHEWPSVYSDGSYTVYARSRTR